MKKAFMIFSLVYGITVQGHAQKSAVYTNKDEAINGYDAVAYFTENQPVKGNKSYSYYWSNATWYFSNSANMVTFKKQPEKYAPQFGGYCAYGVSEGHKAPTDPEAWTITDGKLYLNYNKDVQKLWKQKQAEHIINANNNWPIIKDKE